MISAIWRGITLLLRGMQLHMRMLKPFPGVGEWDQDVQKWLDNQRKDFSEWY